MDQNNVKTKTWVEKLNEQDPQYLKLINFIEMITNSTKQIVVDEQYNHLPKYKQLTKIKFWDFFWNSFKTELLKVNSTNKQIYNEIFDDAILQSNNANSNECTYTLKSNNFISFTFGYDKRSFNFYFTSQHPKYGKIDSKNENNIFKKKYQPVYCTLISEDGVELF